MGYSLGRSQSDQQDKAKWDTDNQHVTQAPTTIQQPT